MIDCRLVYDSRKQVITSNRHWIGTLQHFRNRIFFKNRLMICEQNELFLRTVAYPAP